MARVKRRGFGVISALVVLFSIALLAGAAWLGAGAVKRRALDRGTAALAAGDYAQAAAYLERAEKFSLRGDAAVFFALGEAKRGMGDGAAAKEFYALAARTDGSHAEARYKLGEIYIEEKNFEAARSDVAALEKIGTAEAAAYADELRKELQIGSVKKMFDGILEKVEKALPNLGIGSKPASEDAR